MHTPAALLAPCADSVRPVYVGCLFHDEVAIVADDNAKTRILSQFSLSGGMGTRGAEIAGLLRCKPWLVTVVGTDFAHTALPRLRSLGVDTSYVQEVNEETSLSGLTVSPRQRRAAIRVAEALEHHSLPDSTIRDQCVIRKFRTER